MAIPVARTTRPSATNYENQRDGLRRFLDDDRLRLDNNLSEQHLHAGSPSRAALAGDPRRRAIAKALGAHRRRSR